MDDGVSQQRPPLFAFPYTHDPSTRMRPLDGHVLRRMSSSKRINSATTGGQAKKHQQRKRSVRLDEESPVFSVTICKRRKMIAAATAAAYKRYSGEALNPRYVLETVSFFSHGPALLTTRAPAWSEASDHNQVGNA